MSAEATPWISFASPPPARPDGEIRHAPELRSYVFQPYTMVNDHRTGLKVTDVQKVMDGDIDPFIDIFLKQAGGAR